MVQLADGQNNGAPGNDGNGGADAQADQAVVPIATPSSSSSSAARQAQLAQLKELQARLDEQRRQTQELCTVQLLRLPTLLVELSLKLLELHQLLLPRRRA